MQRLFLLILATIFIATWQSSIYAQASITTYKNTVKVTQDTIFSEPFWKPIVSYYAAFDQLYEYSNISHSARLINIFETPEDNFLADDLPSYLGSENNSIYLPDSLSGTWNDKSLVLADDVFDINSYPARTSVVLLRKLAGGGTRNVCSGTLVAKNVVLTDAHCFVSFDTLGVQKWNDIETIFVAPKYKNGILDTNYQSVDIERVYVPSKYYNADYPYSYLHFPTDFGFAVLKEDIGLDLGWMGVKTPTSAERLSLLKNRVYNFSYPGQAPYTGDDQFFSTSFLSTVNTKYYFSDDIFHFVGQSGSSFFYLNEDKKPVIIGLLHTQEHQFFIPENLVKGINKIIKEPITVGLVVEIEIENYLFPNPFFDEVIINSNPLDIEKIEIINLNGILLKTFYSSDFIMPLNLRDLASGLYVALVYRQNDLSKQVLVKK